MTENPKPTLSEGGRKTLADFGAIKFHGYANDGIADAELAVHALFDLPLNADGRRVNTGIQDFKSPAACIRSFLESAGCTEACMRKPNAIDIHNMPTVGTQAEAKDLVRGLIQTLSDEIQRQFPKEWEEVSRNIGWRAEM